MAENQLKLLGTRRFLPLFIVQFFGSFNNNVFKNSLVILITFKVSDLIGMNSQLLVAIAAGIFIAPFFLFSATAGQLADKYKKSGMIKVIKIIEIILMILAVLGFVYKSIFFLMIVLFGLGTHSAFFGPLKYSILPEHLYENELIAGNGLIEAGTFIAILLGTILGGALILLKYGEYIISFILLLFAVAGWYSSLYIPKTKAFLKDLKVNYNFVSETKKLLLYSKGNRDVFLCILGISWFWLYGATFLNEIPVFAKDILHTNQSVVSLFISMFSVGMAIGSMTCNKLLNGKINILYVPLGILGLSIFTIDLYFASNQFMASTYIEMSQFLQSIHSWRIIADLLFIAISGGFYTVPLYALMQKRSEPSHRARIIASNNVMNALFMVVASIATALMVEIGFSVADIFLALSICNGFVALYIWRIIRNARKINN
ncbi:MFS transporter [Gammaproteobacteria bacterium]|nr:MFS transporter [Gammaproteobacteria bacterium]